MRCCDTSSHCRSHAQSLVRFAEIIVSKIQRDRSFKVLKLFAESIGQPRETAAVHPQRVILFLDERAWVFVFTIEARREPTNFLHFLIHVKNSGRTPALKATASTGVLWRTNNMTEPDVAAEIDRDERKPTQIPSMIYPGQEVVFNQMAPDLNTGLYIVGTLIYDDIFGRRHTNQFCYISRIGEGGMFAVPFHNSTDDEPPQKPQ